MKGFRPAFYNDDPKLRSIELLAWAIKQPCFVFSEMRTAFAEQLALYRDPNHELSERIRKLRKSGMIVVADKGLLDTQEKILEAKLEDPKAPAAPAHGLNAQRLSVIRQLLEELTDPNWKRKAGRPPKLYFTTQAAAKYVETRAEDLGDSKPFRKPRSK